MAEINLKGIFTVRSDTAANWTSVNRVLKTGEFGYDVVNDRLKIGNGASNWNTLKALPDHKIYQDDKITFDPSNASYEFISKDMISSWVGAYQIKVNDMGSFYISEKGQIWATTDHSGETPSIGISTSRLDAYLKKVTIASGLYGNNYYLTLEQSSTGPSDWGLKITDSYNTNNSIQINPSTCWIGKGYMNSGMIAFLDSGIRLGSYSARTVEFSLSSSTLSIIPKDNGLAVKDARLGNNAFSFTRGFISTISLAPDSVSNLSSLTPFSANIVSSNSSINLSPIKSFKITGYDAANKTFTLDSVTGLAINDVYSTACTGINFNDYGKITAINTSTKTVTVDNIASASFGSYLNATPTYNHMCWYIKTKGTVGSVNLSPGSGYIRNNFIMVDDLKDPNINTDFNFLFGTGLDAGPYYYGASAMPRMIIGKYNGYSPGYVFTIGGGTADARKNVFYINDFGVCSAESFSLIGGGSLLEYTTYSGVAMDTMREKGVWTLSSPTNKPTGSTSTYFGGINMPTTSNSSTYVSQIVSEENMSRLYYRDTGSGSSWNAWFNIPVGFCGRITRSTSAPSGGRDGDIHLQY